MIRLNGWMDRVYLSVDTEINFFILAIDLLWINSVSAVSVVRCSIRFYHQISTPRIRNIKVL